MYVIEGEIGCYMYPDPARHGTRYATRSADPSHCGRNYTSLPGSRLSGFLSEIRSDHSRIEFKGTASGPSPAT